MLEANLAAYQYSVKDIYRLTEAGISTILPLSLICQFVTKGTFGAKNDMTAPKMSALLCVASTTLEQINIVDALRAAFALLGIALVAGVRSLMRASALDVLWPAPADGPDSQRRCWYGARCALCR